MEYLKQVQELAKEQEKSANTLDKIKNLSDKVGTVGNTLTQSSNLINGLNPNIAQGMQKYGAALQNGSQAVTNTLNAPQNYFRGFANQTVGNGLTQAGQYLAEKTGLANSIGTGLTNLGTSMAEGATSGAAASGASSAAAATPIGALAALGTMALTGANRNGARQASDQLLNQTNKLAENAVNGANNSLAQTQQNAIRQQATANQELNNGIMTESPYALQEEDGLSEYQRYLKEAGYSDEAINGVAQGLNYGDKNVADWINQYNNGTEGKLNPINIPKTAEEIAAAKAGVFNNTQLGQASQNVKDGLFNKFINGVTDLARGYNENRNNAFTPNNLTNNKFTEIVSVPNQQLINYQNSLRNNGIDENVINAVAQGKNSGNKDIADWIANNQSAYTPEKKTIYYDKNTMGKIGEALGTAARIAQSPAFQGAVAGIAGGALTGNPLYGLGLAQKYANQRANSNAYQDVLSRLGIPVSTGTFGNITSSDMQHIGNMVENKHRNDVYDTWYRERIDNERRKQDEIERKNLVSEQQKGEQLKINKQNADARTSNAATNAKKANNTGKGGKGGKSSSNNGNSNYFVIMKAPNGKVYKVPENQIKMYKAAGGKIVG